jgi:outer membrane biosynthesis protein TonB
MPEQNREDSGKPMDDSFVGNEEVAATQQPVIPPAALNRKPPRKGPLVAALVLLALLGAGGYYLYSLRFRPDKVQEITIDMPKLPEVVAPAPPPPAPVETVAPPAPVAPQQKKPVVRPAKRPATKKAEEPAQPAPRAKEEPVPPPKVEVPPQPKPEQPPVPSSGVMLWSGRVEKNGTIVIDGGRSESGAVNGPVLPGVPVTVRVEPKGFTVEEPPSAANGWKRIAIHSQKKAHIVVTVFWNVKPQ